MLHCVNPSPTGFSGDPNGRWLQTLGPVSKAAPRIDDLNHRYWQTLTTRAIQDERDAWSTSDLTSAENAGCPKQGAIPAWVRTFHSTQRGPVMGCADHNTTKWMRYWHEDKQVAIVVKPPLPGGRERV